MDGSAPWWIANSNNTDGDALDTTSMVVGDEGLIIREYTARLGGEMQTAPHFSILCDKIELGTPPGLLSFQEGDFVDMSLEYIILPRMGEEYDLAESSVDSYTLTNLMSGMTSWERVRAQAVGGNLTVTPVYDAEVERHYPIRVATTNGKFTMFNVEGSALGFVPIVITGLDKPVIRNDGTHGLWLRSSGAANFTLLNQGTDGMFVLGRWLQ